MAIRIVFPEGKGPKSSMGTKVYTDDGHEIKGVMSIDIHAAVNCAIEATIKVHASEIENADCIAWVKTQKIGFFRKVFSKLLKKPIDVTSLASIARTYK